jgi:hypothetical protein
MRSRVPVYSWAFRVTSRYGARVSIITKLKSLTDMISHGQQRNAERDAPSSELRYISGPGIDGLGNLNECTRWRRYVPLSLASLCPHAVSRSFFRDQSPFRQEPQPHGGECRTLYAVCGCSSLLASRRTPALPKWGSSSCIHMRMMSDMNSKSTSQA